MLRREFCKSVALIPVIGNMSFNEDVPVEYYSPFYPELGKFSHMYYENVIYIADFDECCNYLDVYYENGRERYGWNHKNTPGVLHKYFNNKIIDDETGYYQLCSSEFNSYFFNLKRIFKNNANYLDSIKMIAKYWNKSPIGPIITMWYLDW